MTWNHTKLATARGYGARWQRIRERILKRDGYLCQCSECKRLNRVRLANEVDHVVPRSQGAAMMKAICRRLVVNATRVKTVRDNGGSPRARIGVDGFPLECTAGRG
jgi:5-methylcytosine-specific restriction protein A